MLRQEGNYWKGCVNEAFITCLSGDDALLSTPSLPVIALQKATLVGAYLQQMISSSSSRIHRAAIIRPAHGHGCP